MVSARKSKDTSAHIVVHLPIAMFIPRLNQAFRRTIREWPSTLYNVSNLIVAVINRVSSETNATNSQDCVDSLRN